MSAPTLPSQTSADTENAPVEQPTPWRTVVKLWIDASMKDAWLALHPRFQARKPMHQQRSLRRALRKLEHAVLEQHIQASKAVDALEVLETRYGWRALERAIDSWQQYAELRHPERAGQRRAEERIVRFDRFAVGVRVPHRGHELWIEPTEARQDTEVRA